MMVTGEPVTMTDPGGRPDFRPVNELRQEECAHLDFCKNSLVLNLGTCRIYLLFQFQYTHVHASLPVTCYIQLISSRGL
jgi:hypothetical protein